MMNEQRMTDEIKVIVNAMIQNKPVYRYYTNRDEVVLLDEVVPVSVAANGTFKTVSNGERQLQRWADTKEEAIQLFYQHICDQIQVSKADCAKSCDLPQILREIISELNELKFKFSHACDLEPLNRFFGGRYSGVVDACEIIKEVIEGTKGS